LDRLATAPLSEVNVAEVCAEVGVSAPTFFNYFSAKTGALVFYVYLWSVEMQWHMDRATSGRRALEVLFDRTAKSIRKTPWLMPEIIVHQIRSAPAQAKPEPALPPPSVADKLIRFPRLAGIEELQPLGIQTLVDKALLRAVDDAELPSSIDLELANRLLVSLFFGAAASQRNPKIVADTLSRGLELILDGLR
jgi:AcrR family transcriptional regulator